MQRQQLDFVLNHISRGIPHFVFKTLPTRPDVDLLYSKSVCAINSQVVQKVNIKLKAHCSLQIHNILVCQQVLKNSNV